VPKFLVSGWTISGLARIQTGLPMPFPTNAAPTGVNPALSDPTLQRCSTLTHCWRTAQRKTAPVTNNRLRLIVSLSRRRPGRRAWIQSAYRQSATWMHRFRINLTYRDLFNFHCAPSFRSDCMSHQMIQLRLVGNLQNTQIWKCLPHRGLMFPLVVLRQSLSLALLDMI
jgi:hypothetical protein